MRTRSGTIHSERRKKILKEAKGFRGGRRRLYRTAKNAVMKSGQWAYRDRKQKKRFFRRLWITRIAAAAQAEEISYSKLIHALKKLNISLNRKTLSEMAISQPEDFKKLVSTAKEI